MGRFIIIFLFLFPVSGTNIAVIKLDILEVGTDSKDDRRSVHQKEFLHRSG